MGSPTTYQERAMTRSAKRDNKVGAAVQNMQQRQHRGTTDSIPPIVGVYKLELALQTELQTN